jgi:hypothetical protein
VQVIKGIRENSGSRITIASAGTDDRDPAYRLVRTFTLKQNRIITSFKHFHIKNLYHYVI